MSCNTGNNTKGSVTRPRWQTDPLAYVEDIDLRKTQESFSSSPETANSTEVFVAKPRQTFIQLG